MEKRYDIPTIHHGRSLLVQTVYLMLVCICTVFSLPQKAQARPQKAPLPPPAALAATPAAPKIIDLSWTCSDPSSIDGFEIERSQNATSGFVQVTTAASNDSSFVDQGLANAQTYYYRVRSFVKKGRNIDYSSYSSTVSATTASATTTLAPGAFQFSVSTASVSEGAGNVNITINRVGGSDGAVTVDWRTQAQTASYGADYGDFEWTTLTFAAGETSKTLPVSIVDDTLVEGDETFQVQLGNPTGGATLGTTTTSTVTIKDNDVATPQPGAFTLGAASYSVSEGAGNVNITINRVGGSDGAVTVDWRTQGQTATYGADYGDFDWTPVTFAAGETSKTLPVSIVDDTLVEGDETFQVLLGNPTGGAILGTTSTSTVTIKDNDVATPQPGAFTLGAASYSVSEGAGNVNITINRVGGSDGAVTVDWRTQAQTASYGADYGDFEWTTLTFAAGETSKTLPVSIVDDTLVEGDETFQVQLGNPTGGATLGTTTTSTVTIKDNDVATPQPGAFTLGAASYSVSEGAGNVNITINRVGGSDGVVTVDWRTQAQTASYGADYGDFEWTTLTFAAGETSKTLPVSIVDDTLVEGDETFQVQLGNPTGGATLGTTTTSTITIKDNDVATPQPGAFTLGAASYSVNEGAGKVNITINRVGGSDGAVTVDWRTNGVTATYGADYGDFGWTTLTFADGETSKTLPVSIVNDTLVEGDETFQVLLGNPAGGATLGATTTGTVTIKDDDVAATTPQPGAFEFSVASYSVNEGAGKVNITINRVGGSDGVATVDWRTLGQTATSGADYGDFGWTTLTFAAGETSKTLPVSIVDDTLVEGDETFQVLLGNPAGGATLGTTSTSTVTIKDDDTVDKASTTPPPRSAIFRFSLVPKDTAPGPRQAAAGASSK